MHPDEKNHRATTVTKPIELKPKSSGSPGLRRTAALRSSDNKSSDYAEQLPSEELKSLPGVSILPVSRRRKVSPRPEIVEQIGHRLASVYNSVLSQPIPDRFLDLLAELEAGEAPASDESTKKERT